jgi:hypothetical protein
MVSNGNNNSGNLRRDLQQGLARSVSSADWARLKVEKGAGTTLSFREQTVKARTLNQKSRPGKELGSIHSPLKADIKI